MSQSHRQDRASPRQEDSITSPNFTTSLSISSLTARALVSGCSRRGRASCCGRTGSIFLLISATVSAFAFLSLVVLLVGHCTRFGCQVLFSTSISGCCCCCCCQRCLTFLWTPFLHRALVFVFCCCCCAVFFFSLYCCEVSSWTSSAFSCSSDSSSLNEEAALTSKSEGVSVSCFDSCSAVFFHPLTSRDPAPCHWLSKT